MSATAAAESPLATFVVTAEGEVTQWNRAMTAMVGIPAEAAVGQPCWLALNGRQAGGEPICAPGCAIRRDVVAGVDSLRLDMQVVIADPAQPGHRRHRMLTVQHIGIRAQEGRQGTVMHVVDDVDDRRRRERIGERLEALLDGDDALPPLTTRETEVFRLIAAGEGLDGVAQRLFVTRGTAANHVQRILAKLGARSRVEAVLRFLRGPEL